MITEGGQAKKGKRADALGVNKPLCRAEGEQFCFAGQLASVITTQLCPIAQKQSCECVSGKVVLTQWQGACVSNWHRRQALPAQGMMDSGGKWQRAGQEGLHPGEGDIGGSGSLRGGGVA